MKAWFIVVAALTFFACEKKEEAPAKPAAATTDPAPAPAPVEEPEAPPVQVEVTAEEKTGFKESATKEITAENADKAAADLLAEIEADLTAD